MSNDKSKIPSEADVKKALGREPESYANGVVSIVYLDIDSYNASVSRDVEALRKLCEIAESSVCAHDPAKEALAKNPSAPALAAYQPKPDGAQRLVVVFK
jgi:hypothetical protein